MSKPLIPHFALEESSEDLFKYHVIHVAGCRDLIDPEPLGQARDYEELLQAADALSDEFGSVGFLRAASAPCVHKALA